MVQPNRWNVPRDKNYPRNTIDPMNQPAAQCSICRGIGCDKCQNRGWVYSDSPYAKKCGWGGCTGFVAPNSVSNYCPGYCGLQCELQDKYLGGITT